jgi:AcrR family transcriptional regulator
MGKGEATRRRIIEQAAPLFNQRGFAGCSMRDVLEVTGLEKGGLYRHFASKEELAAEAFRYALASAVRLRTVEPGPEDGAVEHLRLHIRHFVETPSTTPGGCPLMNTAIDADDGNAVLRGLAHEGVQAWKKRLSGIVKRGIERGEIRDDVAPRMIANTIIAALEGALMISRLEGTRTALKDAQATLGLLLDRIAVP